MSGSAQGFEISQRRLSLERQQSSIVLQALRLQAGLSQRELARRANVASNTIANAERGQVPLRPTQERIADALSEVLDRKIDRFKLWPLVKGDKAA